MVPLAAQRGASRVAFTVLVSAPLVTPGQQAAWALDQALARAPHIVRRAAAHAVSSGRPFLDYLDTNVSAALAGSGAPMYALWEAQDPTVPVAAAVQELRRLTGGRARIEVIAGAGHTLPMNSGWTARVANWIRSGQPADPQARLAHLPGLLRGVEPTTHTSLVTLPPLPWWADPRLHLVVAASLALLAGLLPTQKDTANEDSSSSAGPPPNTG